MVPKVWQTLLAIPAVLLLSGCGSQPETYWAETASRRESPYTKWKNGPSTSPDYFPVGVSTQEPALYGDYTAAGINLAMRLWAGPTEAQLAALKKFPGVRTFCHQNETGLAHIDDPLIAGWTLYDEPDNAQSMERYWKNDLKRIADAWPGLSDSLMDTFKKGKWGPPVPPSHMVAEYEKYKMNDPSRPVRINFGVSIASKNDVSRGMRTGCMEDYNEYVKAGDLITFDIYPRNNTNPLNNGKFWRQAVGLKRIRQITNGEKPVWNYFETTRIIKQGQKPSEHDIRSQIWISLIHGSQGIMFFAHGMHPEDGSFWDMALHHDKPQMKVLGRLTAEIHALSPVLNNAELGDRVARVKSSVPASAELAEHDLEPIAISCRYYDGSFYIFAARMEDSPTEGTFTVTVPEKFPRGTMVDVLQENRALPLRGSVFKDSFKGYDVHLYELRMHDRRR